MNKVKVNSIRNKKSSLTEQTKSVKNAIIKEIQDLEKNPLRKYNIGMGVQNFNDVTDICEELCEKVEKRMNMLGRNMTELRETLASIPSILMKKMAEYSPSGPEPSSGNQIVWRDKQAKKDREYVELLKVADITKKLAEKVMQIEKNALEHEEIAEQRRKEARNAKLEVERAKKEMLRKKREEEEEARREKERQKQEREEEEKRRREEEERLEKEREEEERRQREEEENQKKIQEKAERRRLEQEEARKRKEEENEKLRKEEEQKKKRDEERRLRREREERERLRHEMKLEAERKRKAEEERRNPKDWEKWLFRVDSEDLPIGCVMRVMPGTLYKNNIVVEKISQLSNLLQLSENEQLVSNILMITQREYSKLSEVFHLAIAHCAPRVPGRELAVKALDDNDVWQYLDSKETSFDDVKDIKLVECQSKIFTTYAVVSKIKTDKFMLNWKDQTLVSSVDSRVKINVERQTFVSPTSARLEVQAIDGDSIERLRQENADAKSLISTSPMVEFKTSKSPYAKRIIASVPLPRPDTGPVRVFNSTIKEKEKPIFILTQPAAGEWNLKRDINMQLTKKKDVVKIILEKETQRLVILQLSDDLSGKSLEKLTTRLEEILYERQVEFILRQRGADPSDTVIVAALSDSMPDVQHRLNEKGYTIGDDPVGVIHMKEGQKISVDFRGNITADEETAHFKTAFNSILKTEFNFVLNVKDKFEQRSRPTYFGFAELYTNQMMPNQTEYEAKRTGTDIVMVNQSARVASLRAIFQKGKQMERSVARGHLKLNPERCVNGDLLKNLAKEIGQDWKAIGMSLNITIHRLQSIEKFQKGDDFDISYCCYTMLETWLKSLSTSDNKTIPLISAFEESGRPDLVNMVEARVQEYRISNMFACLRGDEKVVKDWKFIGEKLKVDSLELRDIQDQEVNDEKKLDRVLRAWQVENRESATPNQFLEEMQKIKPDLAGKLNKWLRSN